MLIVPDAVDAIAPPPTFASCDSLCPDSAHVHVFVGASDKRLRKFGDGPS